MTMQYGRPPLRVVFDFGGVLFNWQPPQLLMRELPARVHDAASARHWVEQIFQGYEGDWNAFDRGLVSVPALVQRIAARTGLLPTEVQCVVDGVPKELQPIPQSVALLQELHAAGVPLHFLSNMPAPYADHLEREHAFLRHFSSGVFSARVQLAKPDMAIYRVAETVFGAAPQELVFLDDHRPNVEAAVACGWRALHFSTAERAAAELRGLGLEF